MNEIILKEKFKKIDDYWDPKIVGEVNDMYVKIAKIKGEFEFHTHPEYDELFYVVKGEITMHYSESESKLKEGEMVIVPHGVKHRPAAQEEAHIMMFESKETLNTGDQENKHTRKKLDWI